MTTQIDEMWKATAIAIGDQVYRSVNEPEYANTADETGYILMFFNVQKHEGVSTLVSSLTDKAELKQLLEMAIRNLEGPKAKVVNRDTMQ